jgi:hypothetical protein
MIAVVFKIVELIAVVCLFIGAIMMGNFVAAGIAGEHFVCKQIPNQ